MQLLQELEVLAATLRSELDAKQAELQELSEPSSQMLGQDLQAAKVIELSRKVGAAVQAGSLRTARPQMQLVRPRSFNCTQPSCATYMPVAQQGQ
jgi:hypothetical protein